MTDDSRKRHANDLSKLLAEDEGLKLFRLLQATALFAPTAPPDGGGPKLPPGPPRVGPFELRSENGVPSLVRIDDSRSPFPWTSRDKSISPTKAPGTKRVCLIGESAAAGMYYGPAVSNAKLLAEALGSTHEVIDLTQIAMQPPVVAMTAVGAAGLEPDVIVVFAGNNWTLNARINTDLADLATAQRYATLLREDGVRGLMSEAQSGQQRIVRKVFGTLGDAAGTAKIIIVIPAVNNADWHRTQPVAWLGGGKTARWHRTYAAARAALAAGELARAATLAEEMIDLDRGTSPTSYRVLAVARQRQGRLDDARAAAMQELGASTWNGRIWNDAGTTTEVAREMRAEAGRRGFSVVDLPSVIAALDPYPGRSLFLDYCHLTMPGMKAAMSSVAAAVLAVTCPDRSPAPITTQPPAVIDGLAKLQMLYANRQQEPIDGTRELVEHWARASLEAWPRAREALRDQALCGGLSAPTLFTSAYQKLFELPEGRDQFFHNSGLWPFLDATGIEVICELLEEMGDSITAEVHEALWKSCGAESTPAGIDISHYSLAGRPIDILNPLLARATLLARGWPFFFSHRALWPASTFYLVSNGSKSLELELTARVPRGPAGRARLSIGGKPVGEVELGSRWSKHTASVSREQLKSGINRVTIEWPELDADDDTPLEEAIQRLERGIPTGILPIFGELYALTARPT